MKKMNSKIGGLSLAVAAIAFAMSAQAKAACSFGSLDQAVDDLDQLVHDLGNNDAQNAQEIKNTLTLDIDANLAANPNAPSGRSYMKSVDGVRNRRFDASGRLELQRPVMV